MKKANSQPTEPDSVRVIRLNSLGPVPDSDSLLAFKTDDAKSGIVEVFEKYWQLVVGSAIKILGDREDAQDAASDIFVKVLDRFRKERPTHFKSWLYKVARNHCIELLRKRKRAPELESVEKLGMMSVVEEDDGQDEVRRSRNLLVRKAMEQLTENQRLCIELFFIEDWSYREIAEETGMDLKAIKSHIQNGKRRLIIFLGPSMNGLGRTKMAG